MKKDAPKNRLSELRKSKRWSQQKLADMVGSHWVTISRLERGEMRLTDEWIERFARALGVSEDEFLPPVRRIFTVDVRGEVHPGGVVTLFEDDDIWTFTLHSGYIQSLGNWWLYVVNDALAPFYQENDLINVVISELPAETFHGRVCMVWTDDPGTSAGVLGVVYRGSKPGTITLARNGLPPLQDIQAKAAAPVMMAVYAVDEHTDFHRRDDS